MESLRAYNLKLVANILPLNVAEHFLKKQVNKETVSLTLPLILSKLFRQLLTLKMPRKPASENVVCLWRLLNILANFSNLFLQANDVLTLKAPSKPASENVVCLCHLLNILANFSNLFLQANSVDPDQTAPKGAV